MSPEILIVVFVLLFVGYVWYSINNLKNKCLCIFRRKNKQRIKKLVPLKDNKLTFEGFEYDIDPRCAGLEWVIVMGIFGTWVIAYDFSWYHRFPHDPNDFENVWDTPDLRKSINLQDRMKAYARGQSQALSGKKPSTFQQYLPWIAIFAVVIVGVMLYNTNQHMNLIEEMMKVPK